MITQERIKIERDYMVFKKDHKLFQKSHPCSGRHLYFKPFSMVLYWYYGYLDAKNKHKT